MFLNSNPLESGVSPPDLYTGKADKLKIQYGYPDKEFKSRYNIFYDLVKANRISQNTQNPVETYMLRLTIVDTGLRNLNALSIDTTDETINIFDILSNNEQDGLCSKVLYNIQKKLHDEHKFENYYDFVKIDKEFMRIKHYRKDLTWQLETNLFISVAVNQCQTKKLI
jgi:hypothetical protein